MKGTPYRTVWILLLSLFLLVVPSSVAAAEPLTAVMTHPDGWEEFDPALRINWPEQAFAHSHIFESLVRRPSHFPEGGGSPQLEPALATHWEHDEEGLVWTFYLREGVQFHRGYGEFTASDVKFSYERAKQGGRASDLAMLDRVVIIDDYTVELHLHEPVAPQVLLTQMTVIGWVIVSEAAVTELGDAFPTQPVGTGAYELVRVRPPDDVVLEAFDDYWGGRPVVDRVEGEVIPDDAARVLALQTGEVDWMQVRTAATYESLVGRDGVKIVFNPDASFSTAALYFNMERDVVADKRVREALLLAIDRELLLEAIVGPLAVGVMHGPLAPSHAGYLPPDQLPVYDYDPERARALLADAGVGDGLSLNTMIRSGRQVEIDTLTAIQGFWEEIGVSMSIDMVEPALWIERQDTGQYDFAIASLGRAEATLKLAHFHSGSVPPLGSGNYAFYSKPELDSLIDAQAREPDAERRAEILREIQLMIMDDLPIAPLYHTGHMTAVRDKWEAPDNIFSWVFMAQRMHPVD